MLVFAERGKPEYPEKNLSEQRREPTTNSTHIWRRVRESNPGEGEVEGECSHHWAIPAPRRFSWLNLPILRDPNAVSRVGRKGATNVFKHGGKSPLVLTLTKPFPNGPPNAGSWLDTKNVLICIIVSNQQTACPEFFSCVCTQWLLSRHTCLVCSPKKCTQSGNFQFDINPVHFKILSTWQLKHGNMCKGILKTLFQNIQAWAYNMYLSFSHKLNLLGAKWNVSTDSIRNIFLCHPYFLLFWLGK